MGLLDDLEQRGLIHEVTDREGLAKLLAEGVVPLYAGYDPTSPSLHVGNLVPTIMLKRFQLAGHRPIVLVGGATGMVGDPSGKSDERNLLDDATLATNLAGIRAQLSTLLDFESPTNGAQMTNNADWTRGISYLEFLRDIGKYITINYMMAKDSVRSRLEGESGISYTEFSYMLLQAFDFVHLAKAHGVRLQVGGSDQYGNITAGCELSRKMGGKQLFGAVAPLMLDATGGKMGKTSTGERVWLDPEKTSPYLFYQYWFNRTDDEVTRFLKWFSLKPTDELDALLGEHDADRAKRIGQRELARALTTWVHGERAVAAAETAQRVMFGSSLDGLTDADLSNVATIVPTYDVARADLAAGITLLDLFARALGESKSAAGQLIKSGGAYVNRKQIKDAMHKVTLEQLATESMLVISGGKKNHRIVRVI
jgi:tyrosyl-tRNA synthetase